MKRMRYVVGGALILGIAAGVWLSDFLKGIGTGDGIGIGQSGMSGVQSTVADSTPELGLSSSPVPDRKPSESALPESLRVLIRDRSFFLRDGGDLQPIELADLVNLVTAVPGDADGIRLRLFRASSARVTAERGLLDALAAADVPEAALYISPEPIDE